MSEALGTLQVSLMHGVGSSGMVWSQLAEIKDFPDLQGIIEGIDKTTMYDAEYTYHDGIKTNDQKSFTCNYNESDFNIISSLEGREISIAIWFGVTTDGYRTPDGSLGKFVGRGYVNVYINDDGVNEVVDMTVVVTLSFGFIEAWDPILVPWTTNTGDTITDNDGNIMYFDISHGGNNR